MGNQWIKPSAMTEEALLLWRRYTFPTVQGSNLIALSHYISVYRKAVANDPKDVKFLNGFTTEYLKQKLKGTIL